MQYVGQTALFSGTKAERKRAKDWERSWVHHMVPLKDLVVSEEFMMFMDKRVSTVGYCQLRVQMFVLPRAPN